MRQYKAAQEKAILTIGLGLLLLLGPWVTESVLGIRITGSLYQLLIGIWSWLGLCMVIIAIARSESSFLYMGLPHPAGTPVAITSIIAPTEEPFFLIVLR